jgi:hypothetical protein
MANNTGNNPQSGNPSELAFHLHDLKQLTEQLSELTEALQRTSAAGDGSLVDVPPPYYTNP